MAFQIVDDALDYCSDTDKLGKAIGKDLEEGKITLPMLYALDHADRQDRKALESILSLRDLDPVDFPKVQEIIKRTRGVEYAISRARQMVEEAKESLNIFESSSSHDALLQLADFTVTRSK
jgi:octaprenyl-diphosphate synthase